MASRKVLCVEDHAGCLRILAELLNAAGYEVVAAASGQQALDLFRQQSIDGVLLEYNLSDTCGAAVRSEMKRVRPEIPILLFSGVGQQTPILIRFFDAYLRDSRLETDAPDALAG